MAGSPEVLDKLASMVDKDSPCAMVVLTGSLNNLPDAVTIARKIASRVFREVIDELEAEQAVKAGVDGLVLKGNESSGRIGSETSFVLLQHIRGKFSLPLWIRGGVTPNTLPAYLVGGASGAILDDQLALAQENDIEEQVRPLFHAMDGTETICLGESLGCRFRVHRLVGSEAVRELQDLEINQVGKEVFLSHLIKHLEPSQPTLLPLSMDGGLANKLTSRFHDVSGILRAYRKGVVDNIKLAANSPPFGENSLLAKSCDIAFPIFQGPMTRVSDVSPFAHAVASAGGLPFLALALMRGTEAAKLMEETATLLGDKPWGVGLLSFLPAELRTEQMKAVQSCKPKWAILAGGRPDQARDLEASGIKTFLHAPSPRLLELYLKEGCRRFIFEGRECGGHVGPMPSFLLWDSIIEVLLTFRSQSKDPIDVVFAGGIHDSQSAAMTATLTAPLISANIRTGVLMGTAYLFTQEAVGSGAIVQGFQELAKKCTDTVLLDAQGGHAIRCIPTAYSGEFHDFRKSLHHQGIAGQEAREHLERLNIGRLRIASKGLKRGPTPQEGTTPENESNKKLMTVSVEVQRQEGMYMIGSVSAFKNRIATISELHQEISHGSTKILSQLIKPISPEQEQEPIAIVGMSCIYPDAPDLERYWAHILNKPDAIREVPSTRWNTDIFYHSDPSKPDRVVSRWGGFISPIEFDPLKYGIPPASIPSIEPMQLLVLEVTQRALEHSCLLHRPIPRERTAVIIGAGGGACDLGLQYQTRAMMEHYLSQMPQVDKQAKQQVMDGLQQYLPALTEDSFAGTLCNVAAGRVANRFNFSGPNFAVDAACASSLAALDMSVMELREKSSDLVILGGGDAQMNISSFLMFSKTHALSPRGRCRPFDATADGIAISEGLAGIILKRLSDAIKDGDQIYALIRSVGSASDGKDKSLTAPSLHGQIHTLERSYAQPNLSPCTVGLVEAHGTGTVLGDS
ncbi:MAG: beta-ketoacyl synthase N-terminal-like domain-containing protein, partial [Gemmataceae bacterium]